MEMKSASEWYVDDTKWDILDPDGWNRSSPTVSNEWWLKPITWEQYEKKRDKCTITTYMRNKHQHPFSPTPDITSGGGAVFDGMMRSSLDKGCNPS